MDQDLQVLFDRGLDPKSLGIYLQAILEGKTAQLPGLFMEIRRQLRLDGAKADFDEAQRADFDALDVCSEKFFDSGTPDEYKLDLVKRLLLEGDLPDVDASDISSSPDEDEAQGEPALPETEEFNAQVVELPVQSAHIDHMPDECASAGN